MGERGPYAKGLAKREEILDVAIELYARTGYDRLSVREIAREAGLSQAGLLYHFANKEELFLEVLRRRDAATAAPDERDRSHSAERLRRVVRENPADPNLMRLFVSMSAEGAQTDSATRGWFTDRYARLLGRIADDVREHQERGEMRDDIDAADIASLLIAAADGLQIQWLLDPDHVDMSARFERLWGMLSTP